MSENFIEYIKEIDKLQGLVYQNLMSTFNELEESVNTDFDNFGNITNIQQMKQVVLSRLKVATNLVNSPGFKKACITCSAVRVLGLIKYKISSEYLTEEQQVSSLGEVVTDYKIDKKYTEKFYETINELKNNISKFISSKPLRKQFILDNFCIQHLKKEKSSIDKTYSSNNEIIAPEWLTNFGKDDFDNFIKQVIELLNQEDYEGFNKLIVDNNCF